MRRVRADPQLTRICAAAKLSRGLRSWRSQPAFSPGARVLSVFGDSASNNIRASRDAAGRILINGGAVPILGGNPTVANTDLIQLFGQAGNDTITVDETNGPMPAAQLFGGDGNDILTGGSAK